MITYSRRPTVSAHAIESLVVRELGSGANAVGYYMFHGGATPRNQSAFLSEEPSGVPKISYDFQAPIGQYGQLAESYGYLKLIHYFLNDFGSILRADGNGSPRFGREIEAYRRRPASFCRSP